MPNTKAMIRCGSVPSSLPLHPSLNNYHYLVETDIHYDTPKQWENFVDLVAYKINPRDYAHRLPSKCIKGGEWKYIHRLIATMINTRDDDGARLVGGDLALLLAIHKNDKLDLLQILLTTFSNRKTRTPTIEL